jgi:hypothetical protein
MKKHSFGYLLIFLLAACSKTEVKPTIADSNGALIAGAKGSNKTWAISSGTYSMNGGATQTLTLDPCLTDNVFKFSNDDLQSFEHTEGVSKCTSTDSTIVEKGSWAFTADGKKLIMDVIPYSNQYLFFNSLGTPLSVNELTDSSMKISFNIVDGTTTYVLNFVFVKK